SRHDHVLRIRERSRGALRILRLDQRRRTRRAVRANGVQQESRLAHLRDELCPWFGAHRLQRLADRDRARRTLCAAVRILLDLGAEVSLDARVPEPVEMWCAAGLGEVCV